MTIETRVDDQIVFFDDEKHKFWKTVDGKKVPISSVTAFTEIIDKSAALIGWAVKLTRQHLIDLFESGEIISADHVLEACKQHTIKNQEAADIGTQIHGLVEG